MDYDLNYKNYGWICSRCGRSFSPSTNMCPYCSNDSKIYYGTTATPKWIYKEDTKTGSIDDWWSTYLKQTTADSSGNIDNSKTITWNITDSKMIDELLRSDFFDNNNLWEKPL